MIPFGIIGRYWSPGARSSRSGSWIPSSIRRLSSERPSGLSARLSALTQSDLAAASGLSLRFVSELERGRASAASAACCGCSRCLASRSRSRVRAMARDLVRLPAGRGDRYLTPGKLRPTDLQLRSGVPRAARRTPAFARHAAPRGALRRSAGAAFFAGLLPDDRARERWRGTSEYLAIMIVALLSEVGGECAGASLSSSPDVEPPPAGEGAIDPLEELPSPRCCAIYLAGHCSPAEELRLSLAGAQDKMALVYRTEPSFSRRRSSDHSHLETRGRAFRRRCAKRVLLPEACGTAWAECAGGSRSGPRRASLS